MVARHIQNYIDHEELQILARCMIGAGRTVQPTSAHSPNLGKGIMLKLRFVYDTKSKS
jgi:hypothetical protein